MSEEEPLIEKLTLQERVIFKWQYKRDGAFRRALMEAIARADDQNMERMRAAFPTEVEAFLRFKKEAGWWPALEKKLEVLLREAK